MRREFPVGPGPWGPSYGGLSVPVVTTMVDRGPASKGDHRRGDPQGRRPGAAIGDPQARP